MNKHLFDLQRFAEEETTAPDASADGGQPEGDSKPEGKTYTDADVDRIINDKFAKWSKAHAQEIEDARKEGEKLAKMNADQKAAYAKEQMEKENATLKDQLAKYQEMEKIAGLRKTAAEVFANTYKLTVSDAVLDLVVGKDAETTNANIEKMAKALQAEREAGEKVRATGVTPAGTGFTNQPIDAIQAKINKYKK